MQSTPDNLIASPAPYPLVRQLRLQHCIPIRPNESPDEGDEGQVFTTADLGIDRPGTRAGKGPAQAEECAADCRPFMKVLALE